MTAVYSISKHVYLFQPIYEQYVSCHFSTSLTTLAWRNALTAHRWKNRCNRQLEPNNLSHETNCPPVETNIGLVRLNSPVNAMCCYFYLSKVPHKSVVTNRIMFENNLTLPFKGFLIHILEFCLGTLWFYDNAPKCPHISSAVNCVEFQNIDSV